MRRMKLSLAVSAAMTLIGFAGLFGCWPIRFYCLMVAGGFTTNRLYWEIRG